MKLNFTKIKKDNPPPLKSLRPQIFNIKLSWFWMLGASLFVFAIMAIVGFKLFYSQYFETYKNKKSADNFENVINAERLNNAIQKRNDFINGRISLPADPLL